MNDLCYQGGCLCGRVRFRVSGPGKASSPRFMKRSWSCRSIAPAFNGTSGGYQFSRVYSNAEWQALKLPGYATAWDTDPNPPSVLMEIDLVTRTAVRVTTIPGVELLPTIAPWAP